ncbi:MAG: hypothetical protein K5880_14830 [Hydrogenophaga sp.]|uniref:hypothetical protein n=1 Tax=Hydrogenophaga sp. TaxID=1904254 RepID=UPI0026063F25|nr:hypothetical protein [Hydrogenophaga sp.]MCV0439872.1 hypothetical protein [Hydrogenophaga sp.]
MRRQLQRLSADDSFDRNFDRIGRQVDSTFRFAKFFAVGAILINLALAGGLIYLLYAAAQWLMANA